MGRDDGGASTVTSEPESSEGSGHVPSRRVGRWRAVPGLRPRSARTGRARAAWIASAVALAAAAVVVSTVAGAHQWHKPTFDLLDEQGHLDYVEYLSHGDVPKWGDLYTAPTVHMLNCLGIIRQVPQPCIANVDPTRYAPKGFSYEAQQPPLAYLAYLPFLQSHAPPADALGAARRGGVVWLAIAAALLVVMAWLADMALLQTMFVLAVCLLNPWAIHAAATVTNDSSALAAGSVSIVMVQIARRRRATMAVPALVVGLLVGLLKSLFCVAPLALLVGGLLTERPRRRRLSAAGLWRRHGCEVCLLGGAVVAAVAFLLWQDARATVPSNVVLHALLGGRVTSRPRWSTLESSLQNGFSAFVPNPGQPLYWIWNVLVYGSTVGLLLNRSSGRDRAARALAGGTLVGLVVLALGFSLLDWFQGHFNYVTPSRYGLVLVPLLAYVGARAMRPSALILAGLVLPALAVTAAIAGHPY